MIHKNCLNCFLTLREARPLLLPEPRTLCGGLCMDAWQLATVGKLMTGAQRQFWSGRSGQPQAHRASSEF